MSLATVTRCRSLFTLVGVKLSLKTGCKALSNTQDTIESTFWLLNLNWYGSGGSTFGYL